MPQMQVLCLLLNRDKVDLDIMPQFSAVSQLDSSFTVYKNTPVALSSLKKESCLMVVQDAIMQMKDHICAKCSETIDQGFSRANLFLPEYHES